MTPPHEDAQLWRYMDIPKYLDMLSSNAIWFSRSDLLGDPFEGSTTKMNKDALLALYKQIMPAEFAERNVEIYGEGAKQANFYTYVNSWHCSDIESAAMWRLYRKDYGISIVSSLKRMVASVTWKGEIFPSQVNYIDYTRIPIPQGNGLWPYVHKRKSFEHEKEFRLITLSVDAVRALTTHPFPETDAAMSDRTDKGLLVPANLKTLISEVRIDPSAPEWFMSSIADITKKMGFTFDVKQSVLGQDPIY